MTSAMQLCGWAKFPLTYLTGIALKEKELERLRLSAVSDFKDVEVEELEV
jgi:hypothetical protein